MRSFQIKFFGAVIFLSMVMSLSGCGVAVTRDQQSLLATSEYYDMSRSEVEALTSLHRLTHDETIAVRSDTVFVGETSSVRQRNQYRRFISHADGTYERETRRRYGSSLVFRHSGGQWRVNDDGQISHKGISSPFWSDWIDLYRTADNTYLLFDADNKVIANFRLATE